MRYIKILLVLIGLQPLTSLLAQQENQFTQYTFNQGIINPSYIGSVNYMSLQISSRNQWIGFPGAPKSNAITVGYPFKYLNSAVGVTAILDDVGPLKNSILTFNYAHSIKLTDKIKLSMGLSAGVNHYAANLDLLQTTDANDLLLQQGSVRHSSFTFGSGVFLYAKKWYLGVSVPKIVTNSFSFDNNQSDIYHLKERNHLYMVSGYVFGFNKDKIKLKPSVCVKKVQNVKPTIDVSFATSLYNKLTVGAGLRDKDTYLTFLQLAVGKHLNVGYAYDFSNSRISNFSGGSHEIVLDIRFHRDAAKIHSPRFF